MYHEYAKLKSAHIDRDACIFIPVGSMEGHGPSLPLGTDTYIAQAFSVMFAKSTGGIVFPPVFFGVSPNTFKFDLTINFSHETLISIIKDICKAFNSKGFKKLLIVNIHNGNDAAIKAVIEKLYINDSIKAYYINPYTFLNGTEADIIFKSFDNSYKEACLFWTANDILKLDVERQNELQEEKCIRSEEISNLRKYGYAGFSYNGESQHIAVRKNINPEKGLEYMVKAVEKVKELVKCYEKYISM